MPGLLQNTETWAKEDGGEPSQAETDHACRLDAPLSLPH